MDELHPVEVFRSMCFQTGIVYSGETSLTGGSSLLDLLSSDEGAVSFFFNRHLSQPKSWIEQTERMAYSALERTEMFKNDIVVLSNYALYLELVRFYAGHDVAAELVATKGFSWFRFLENDVVVRLLGFARFGAAVKFCDLRLSLKQRRTKDVGKLLTQTTH